MISVNIWNLKFLISILKQLWNCLSLWNYLEAIINHLEAQMEQKVKTNINIGFQPYNCWNCNGVILSGLIKFKESDSTDTKTSVTYCCHCGQTNLIIINRLDF